MGMACRSAGASDPGEFWQLMQQGDDCIEGIREQSWLDFFAAHSQTPVPARYGQMQGKEHFDAAFFGIGRDEAASMDFPQRVLLEDTYTALEDAGIAPSSLQKRPVGVFIGSVGGGAQAVDLSMHSLLGTDTGALSSHIAYFLDLKGPALTVNTACSSSLMAMDVACQYLRSGKIDLAIVGGATIYTDPRAFIMMNNAGILSPTATCRPFDNNADGMIVGDGSGVVILKRLDDAERDQDPVYGVIAAISSNQNGQTAGRTVPSYLSQSQLQSSLYRDNRINVEDIQYIEAHGTATKLGDAIEVDALKHSFQQFTDKKHYCAIGSVKANIGHTTAASGVLSVIKVLLGFRHRFIPPSLNFERCNEYIDFENTPFYVNTTLQEWPENAVKPRMAAVTSLGHGGTNVHVVLEEYLPDPALPQAAQPEAFLIPLSAKTPESLAEYALRLALFIRQDATLDLNALAHTLQVGRERMKYRSIFQVKTLQELAAKLEWLGRGGARNERPENYWQGEGKVRNRPYPEQSFESESLAALAERWADGDIINWQALYSEDKPQRLHLPTYVFAKTGNIGCSEKKPEAAKEEKASKEQQLELLLKKILAHQLDCPLERVDSRGNFFELGLTSLGLVNMLKSLEQLTGRKIASSIVFEYRSIDRLEAYLTENYTDIVDRVALADYAALLRSSIFTQPSARFPELILLNENGRGQPVFWFHGGLGGVQPYHILAEVCERPFYGIQAKGWMSEQPSIHGVPAMAAYYIQAMQAVQPAGPYDLGGYSLGGLIAYEVTRQLQERGESVATIVMLDTFDTTGIKDVKHSAKNDFLQAVNIALQTTVMQNPEAFSSTLIHRDQLDVSLSDEAFLQQLLDLAKTRGLPYSEEQMYELIRKQSKVQTAHDAHRYRMLPLAAAESVDCYYFRNKNGLYLGELEPYFALAGYEYDLDKKKHWQIWQEYLPRFSIVDMDASNHLVFLSEPDVCKSLIDFFRVLYSEAGMTTELFRFFQQRTIEKHGVLSNE
ncbi:MAG: beta-ketoacyl synthase N-terminal-like domain-containing protein [Methylobacter sp.]